VQPLDPDNFVRQLVLPQMRGRVSPRVIRTDPLPGLANRVAATVQEPGAVKQVAAARTRIEYQEGTRTFEEDIYSVMVYSQVPMTPGLTWWGPERLFGFRAEKGQLDRQAPLLEAIFASARVNQLWFAHVLQVREAWIQNQMQVIRNAAELSRYIARTSNEISDMQQQAWENRRASEDRSAEAFSEYIRGVETYRDPYAGREVQLPTGYADVWASRDGDYILANDPNLNPNVSAQGTWQRIDPSHH
jgi:rubrerythrin